MEELRKPEKKHLAQHHLVVEQYNNRNRHRNETFLSMRYGEMGKIMNLSWTNLRAKKCRLCCSIFVYFKRGALHKKTHIYTGKFQIKK